jgi:CBS domain-containing protein
MKVETILQRKGNRVVTVAPHASMQIVIGRMILERVVAVVVSQDGQTPAVILSERDIVRGLTARGAALFELRPRI